MRNYLDDTKLRLFEIREQRRNKVDIWHIKCTNREIHERAKAMREINGYVRGVGGDRNYSLVVTEVLI